MCYNVEAIQSKEGPISKNDNFSTQTYNIIVDLESRQKITHFQKKWNLISSPDVPVRSSWSCKMQD